MHRPLVLLALGLALTPAFAAPASDADQPMTQAEYRKGLEKLRGYLEKRGEDPAVAERFIGDLENSFRLPPGQKVPVTRGVFEAFLKNEAAWARKTRDSKNPEIAPDQLAHEVARQRELRADFKQQAAANSPRFYRAFQAAVRDVRSVRRGDGKDYAGNSAVFFGDQVDDSYSHVDAGDEAVDNGDSATAIAEADKALADNPANADALVLRAGAEYDQQNTAAATADAQAALALDPGNQQAQAVLSLTAANPEAAQAALAGALAGSAGLADDGRAGALPHLAIPAALTPNAGSANPFAASRQAPPTPTPAVARLLSADLGAKAVSMAGVDLKGSINQLDHALALDPGNASARDWHATFANRAGHYAAALGSAMQGLANDPADAHAFFNKAYALAGAGDKAGMDEAMTQAARVDPSYQPVLKQVLPLAPEEALDQVFGTAAAQRQPMVPQPRRHGHSLTHYLTRGFGALGLLMLLAGASLFFRNTARPAVSR